MICKRLHDFQESHLNHHSDLQRQLGLREAHASPVLEGRIPVSPKLRLPRSSPKQSSGGRGPPVYKVRVALSDCEDTNSPGTPPGKGRTPAPGPAAEAPLHIAVRSSLRPVARPAPAVNLQRRPRDVRAGGVRGKSKTTKGQLRASGIDPGAGAGRGRK